MRWLVVEKNFFAHAKLLGVNGKCCFALCSSGRQECQPRPRRDNTTSNNHMIISGMNDGQNEEEKKNLRYDDHGYNPYRFNRTLRKGFLVAR